MNERERQVGQLNPNDSLRDALAALYDDDRRRSVQALLELSAIINVGGKFPDTRSVCEEFITD